MTNYTTVLTSFSFMMNFKTIPYSILEFQNTMQKHHPVVKGENCNIYSDHSKSSSICVIQHTLTEKKKAV